MFRFGGHGAEAKRETNVHACNGKKKCISIHDKSADYLEFEQIVQRQKKAPGSPGRLRVVHANTLINFDTIKINVILLYSLTGCFPRSRRQKRSRSPQGFPPPGAPSDHPPSLGSATQNICTRFCVFFCIVPCTIKSMERRTVLRRFQKSSMIVDLNE